MHGQLKGCGEIVESDELLVRDENDRQRTPPFTGHERERRRNGGLAGKRGHEAGQNGERESSKEW